MVLNRIHVQKLGPGAVCHNQTVAGRPVMVGGCESSDMQTSEAAGSDKYRLGLDYVELFGVKAVTYGPGAITLVVHDKFHRRQKFADGYHVGMVFHFIHQGPHDDCTGIITAREHSFS